MPPMTIDIKVDMRDAIRRLNELEKKQLPYATSRAITSLAKLSVVGLQADMRRVFDRPNPWTLQAFYAKPAKKGDPTAWVGTREFGVRTGRPAWKYLRPELEGGARNKKAFELKLSAVSGGLFVVPTSATPLDRYGNIAPGFLTQVISRLGAGGEQNVSAKTTARLRRLKRTVAASGHRSEYFVAHAGGKPTGTPLGVYKLTGKDVVVKVLAFTTEPPHYSKHMDFEASVNATVQKHWQTEFRKALDGALSTHKPK